MFSNITKTLFSFFETLGYEIYLNGNVKEGANFPYISIDYELAEFGEEGLIQGRIWDKGTSRVNVNNISDKLLIAINKGINLKINNENGYIYLLQGSPFIQSMNDETGLQVNYFNIIMKTYY